jgi:hypothetical protein
MAFKNDITRKKFYSLIAKGFTYIAAANELGISKQLARHWNIKQEEKQVEADELKESRPFFAAQKAKSDKLTTHDLEIKLAELEAELVMTGVAKELVSEAKDTPIWMTDAKQKKNSHYSTTGVPVIFASDWHFGENVNPLEINNVNEFNRTIARERARRFFDRAEDLLTNHIVNPKYPGIVLLIGGDMVTGEIHEELANTNDCTTPEAWLDLYEIFRWGITKLADRFGKVFIPCVTGNHGRMTHKLQHKQRNKKNWDWMLYSMLADWFKNDKRVQFSIAGGTDTHFKIYNKRFCLSHGDQFRGGDGMIGAIGPIMRGNHKKKSRNSAVDLSYDILLLGHWHQYIQLESLIVNGSLKGMDEYAYANNFGFESPQQAMFVVHPKHGITIRMPIKLDDARVHEKEWLSVKF